MLKKVVSLYNTPLPERTPLNAGSIKNAPAVLRYIDTKAIKGNDKKEVDKNRQPPAIKKSIPKRQKTLP